uniref:Uncharacterized protein n=1 Tax=Timema genevievae TaxID=629358 RepID=A0A7R9JQK8_TIMGE|nr:unnamed protein product [Timema genevievae]
MPAMFALMRDATFTVMAPVKRAWLALNSSWFVNVVWKGTNFPVGDRLEAISLPNFKLLAHLEEWGEDELQRELKEMDPRTGVPCSFVSPDKPTLPIQVTKEVAQVQAMGKPIPKESKYVDIYREKPIRVAVKVLVPIKEHPKGTEPASDMKNLENISLTARVCLSAPFDPAPFDSLMSFRRLDEKTSPISRE